MTSYNNHMEKEYTNRYEIEKSISALRNKVHYFDIGLHERIIAQLIGVCQTLNISRENQECLEKTAKELWTTLPLSVGSEDLRLYTIYQTQYRADRNRYVGQIEYCEEIDPNYLRGLSTWLSWKCTLLDLPCSGIAGAINSRLDQESQAELEKLLHSCKRVILDQLPPGTSAILFPAHNSTKVKRKVYPVISPTMGENARMPTTKERLKDKPTIEKERNELRADGIAFLTEEIAKRVYGNLSPCISIGVSGKGSVVTSAAQKLTKWSNKIRTSNSQKANIMVLADPHTRIGRKKALEIDADIVLEAKDGSITPEGNLILAQRGILVVPDLLVNTSDVILAHLALLQGNQFLDQDRTAVKSTQKSLLNKTLTLVWNYHLDNHVSLRTACLATVFKKLLKNGSREHKPNENISTSAG